jgi:phosphoglycerol geranylgeranyltransferase
MKVLERICRSVAAGDTMHMTLLDPDKQPSEDAGTLAAVATQAGTDAVMVGGSTGVTPEKVDATVRAIKAATDVPVILFPAGAHALSRHADAVYFMSMLNSRNLRLIVGEQKKAALLIREWGLEAIPMGYLVVEPGMRVAEIGDATPIPRSDVLEAVRYALAAQYLGMGLVYLEAGSGAPSPVPRGMVRAVKDVLDVPLVVGGGIRTPTAARTVCDAGADVVVTGTAFEVLDDREVLRNLVDAVKGR